MNTDLRDHCKAVPDLLKMGVDIYANKETFESVNLKNHHRIHIIKNMEQFKIGDWKIKGFDLVHDCPNFGFIMAKDEAKILYCTDTNYVPVRVKGLTHVCISVNYCANILMANADAGLINIERAKRTLRNHLSLQTALDFFRSNDMSRVQEIWLLHLSDANSNAKRFKEEIMAITGRPVYL